MNASADNLKLHTGPVFEDAPAPLGALWAELSSLEDEIALHMSRYPIGSVFDGGSQGWALAMTDRGVELTAGAMVDGSLREAQSRFEIELDWVDIDEDALEDQIDALRDALARLELGEGPKSIPRVAADLEAALQGEVLQSDPTARFIAPSAERGAKVYLGPVAATIGGAFAQRIGRGVYAVHLMDGIACSNGATVEVKYRSDSAPSLTQVVGRGVER